MPPTAFDIHTFDITSDQTLIMIANDLHIDLNWIGFENDLIDQAYGNGAYILNIGDDTGTHWVCLNVQNDVVFYFDSFAVPMNDVVLEWCSKNNVDTIHYNNKKQFQLMNQSLCGIWCIVFLYDMQKKNGSIADRFQSFCNQL